MSYFVGRSFGPGMAFRSISLLIVFTVFLISCEDPGFSENGHGKLLEDKTHLNDTHGGQNRLVAGFSPDFGSSGTVVTIVGKRFSPKIAENAVRFSNQVEALILEASPTKLKVVVPAGAITGPITVTSRGISIVSDGVFTYVQSEHEYLKSISDQLRMVWRNENGDILRIDFNCSSSEPGFPESNPYCYSPAEDKCEGYRGVTGNEIGPACFATAEECTEAGYDRGVYIPLLRNVASQNN